MNILGECGTQHFASVDAYDLVEELLGDSLTLLPLLACAVICCGHLYCGTSTKVLGFDT